MTRFARYRPLRALIGAALLVAAPRFAGAADEEPEALIRQGVELRKKGDDARAHGYFKRAYDIAHTPRSAAQLGLVEYAIEDFLNAEAHLTEALASGDPWVRGNRSVLEKSREEVRSKLGAVEVRGAPLGTRVVVAGRAPVDLPGDEVVWVEPGDSELQLTAPGHKAVTKKVSVAAGARLALDVDLQREDLPKGQAPPNVAAEPGAAAQVVQTASPVETPPSSGRRIAKWTALGLAGASLGVAAVGTALLIGNVGKLEDGGCFDRDGQAVDAAGVAMPGCQGTLDAAKTDQLLQIVGIAAAGAFAATWLVLTLTEPPRSSGERHARMVCAPSIVSPGLACEARF